MDAYQLLKDAYSDEDFEKELQSKRLIIESELSEFIKSVNNRKKVKLKIFENLESRVKSVDSFCEKIKRKNYIDTWEILEDKTQNQGYIADNLPDLIGFRINCFFYEDEKIIYDELKKYYDDGKFGDEYYLNFSENTKQANGHTIYKVSGKYEKVNFEIQIKCSVHNIWGEVEHSRIYKSEHYDPKVKSKKIITEEVFKILKSSDQQLKTIFEEKYSKDDLIKSLFYQYSHESIVESENVTILSNHYKHFFDIFNERNHMRVINKFVSDKLIEVEYIKEKLTTEKPTVMTSSEFRSRYIPFEIEVIHKITSLLYKDLEFDDFIDYLIKIKEDSAKIDDEFSIPGDDFNPEKEKEDIREAIFVMYDKYFELREER